MAPARRRSDEAERLEWLRKAAILDTPQEKEYDDITQMLCRISGFPMALVSLVDDTRQWFKARTGLKVPETSRVVSFCDHVVENRKPLIVLNAEAHPSFCDNPLVTGELGMRCYIGYPIIPSSTTHCFGSLCCIDTIAHESISENLLENTGALANIVSALIDRNLKASLFVAKISHELRTPLHGVLGFASLLKQSLTSDQAIKTKSDQVGYVDNIAACADGNLRIVNDILDLAKMQHHKLELEIADFDLRTCIESALATVAAMPKAAKLHLGYLLPHDLTLKGDGNRLRQILLNLLSNAVKFTKEGSVRLTCRVMNTEDAMQVQFLVADTGVGISPQDCKHLMQAFSQVTSSISRQPGGTGLGLLICRYLLNAMDSELEFSSVPDKGSKFFFTLRSQGTVHLPPPEAKGKSALIIDSGLGETEILRGHCESLAMKVVSVRSVEVAQLLLTSRHEGTLRQPKYKFDVVLCASTLLNGIDTDLHELNINAGLPWVLVGNVSDAMVGTTNVSHVTSSLLQTNLKDMLLTLFKQSGTDDRALTDKADPSPEKSCDVKSSNAHLDNAPQFAEMTVLSVDDVDMNQIIVQAFVARLGAHVDVAANGNEAINAARNKRYDLILMDVVMPVMGGVEATQILKREQPLTPVVMVTASSDASTLDKCRSSGANHVMHKPFTFEALAAQLKEVRKVSGLRVDNNPERNSSPPAGDTVPASSSVTSSSSTAQLRSSIFQPSFQSIGDKKATTRTGDDSPLSFDTISSFAGPNMLNAPSSARALPPKRRPRLFFGADVRIGSS